MENNCFGGRIKSSYDFVSVYILIYNIFIFTLFCILFYVIHYFLLRLTGRHIKFYLLQIYIN